MSRTFKDRPMEVRRSAPAAEIRRRPRNRHGKVIATGALRRVRREDMGGQNVHVERRDLHPRFYTNVSSQDIHEGWWVPERMHVRTINTEQVKRARVVLEHGLDIDELDDSDVQPVNTKRNSTWGGGYYD